MIPCVSQGATPIGPEMTITAAGGNLIGELASRPAIERLREAIGDLRRASSRRRPGPAARPGDRREPARVRARRLPRPPDHRRRPRRRARSRSASRSGRPDGPHARPRRRHRRRGTCARRSRQAGGARRRRSRGRAVVHLQRPRVATCSTSRPRRRRARGCARRAGRRLLLRRRDRPGRGAQLPARVHGDDRGFPADPTAGR